MCRSASQPVLDSLDKTDELARFQCRDAGFFRLLEEEVVEEPVVEEIVEPEINTTPIIEEPISEPVVLNVSANITEEAIGGNLSLNTNKLKVGATAVYYEFGQDYNQTNQLYKQ